MNNSECRKIGLIAAIALAIATMVIPGANLASTAYASHDKSIKNDGTFVHGIDNTVHYIINKILSGVRAHHENNLGQTPQSLLGGIKF